MTRVLSVLTRHAAPDGSVPASPPARRPPRAWWRDARVSGGIALISVAMVGGARLLAGGSDTTTAWQATRDLAQGAVVSPGDVVAVTIPAALAGAYADGAGLPTAPLDRALLEGEILPVATDSVAADARWVTVPVEPLHAPIDLASGERVDVWATDGTDLGVTPAPELVLEGVLVSEVSVDGVGLGGEYGVVLEISPRDAAALIAAARSGGIDLVRVPAVTR
ncbi:MAG: hypothetical protein ACO21P_01745 [Candidatus Nanopelagicales bacterium]